MPEYKVIFTIEVNTLAENEEEAEQIALDCADWSNASVEVLEKVNDEE
tara:strand:+ start:106 stop:249 length:144 start_codon:yes stop_codon:yes gene_type:complete